ncbi:hypothetical protein BJP40_06680 [Streptomyces sp. CC53]|uniref:hypothetical protein n=1 Tax=Streptomyces sp. CC53 TaxID=1906740 RepID=UPI0008DDEADA|nr:hypothetical protein [Streptomyces sp. CC53]OII61206.1 hypothetical protein BJP40_06680 [Streptomyces sp. CC53]
MANNIRQAVGRSHTVLASAARTATPDTEELEVPAGAKFGVFVLDATAAADTPSVTMKIEGVDRTSGKVWLLLEDAAVTGVATSTLKIGPGLTAAANEVANDFLPPVIRITCTHADADSITYSVGAHFS